VFNEKTETADGKRKVSAKKSSIGARWNTSTTIGENECSRREGGSQSKVREWGGARDCIGDHNPKGKRRCNLTIPSQTTGNCQRDLKCTGIGGKKGSAETIINNTRYSLDAVYRGSRKTGKETSRGEKNGLQKQDRHTHMRT